MKAMILAAGRGKRMGQLTEDQPKPLLMVGGRSLIEWQIQRLKASGFNEIVINVGYLGEKICDDLGSGEDYGVNIAYSIESQRGLETGGGVLNALPLLGDKPFLLTNADVFCDYPYRQLASLQPKGIHLVLVPNPPFKPAGDFSLNRQQLLCGDHYTFAGISVINPQLFAGSQPGFFPIAPLFYQAIDDDRATGEVFDGVWFDVGTPARLAMVNKMYG